MDLVIKGERGPAAMLGVLTYPYTTTQKLYHKEFSAVAAYTIQHPYMATAKPTGSTPHNLLSGMGFADTPHNVSETEHSFGFKSYVASRSAKGSGIRVEQM